MNRKIAHIATMALLAISAASALPAGATAGTTAQGGNCTTTHRIQSGETLYRIARRYGTTVAELQRLNNLGTSTLIYAGNNLCVSMGSTNPNPPTGTSYTVQPGDILSRIARRFGVDMNVLARVNNIRDVNRIYVGQVLTIPDFTTQ
ncbi:MAG: LysM peptidoglycan-binding domain-containing protein [Anaerolineae bacterium]|nr:LysM peptidoglycan-binding domain-containing protein [Anaerolineae bacterium]